MSYGPDVKLPGNTRDKKLGGCRPQRPIKGKIDMLDYVRVSHTVKDGNHVVKVYAPDGLEYCKGVWPVTELTSLDAIWSGLFQGDDVARVFGVPKVTIHSTDAEAFAAYCAECEEMDRHE